MERTNYIYVDGENVRALDLDLITNRPVVVVLVLGEHDKALPVPLVGKMLEHPNQVRIERSVQTGKNALDFVLACLVGQRVAAEPTAFYHIVSRDKGFDALVKHLKERKIFALRHDEFSLIPILLPVESMTPEALVELAKNRLGKNPSNRPKKRKGLLNLVHGLFGKRLAPEQVEAVLQRMVSTQAIEIGADEIVRYAFDRLP